MGLNARELRSYALRTYNDPRYVFSMGWRDGLDLIIYDIERENNKKVDDIRNNMYQNLFCSMIKHEIKYFTFDRFVEFLEHGTDLYDSKVKDLAVDFTDEELEKKLNELIDNTVWREV